MWLQVLDPAPIPWNLLPALGRAPTLSNLPRALDRARIQLSFLLPVPDRAPIPSNLPRALDRARIRLSFLLPVPDRAPIPSSSSPEPGHSRKNHFGPAARLLALNV